METKSLYFFLIFQASCDPAFAPLSLFTNLFVNVGAFFFSNYLQVVSTVMFRCSCSHILDFKDEEIETCFFDFIGQIRLALLRIPFTVLILAPLGSKS